VVNRVDKTRAEAEKSLIFQGFFPVFSGQYGLKAARRAPQFSKR